MKPMTFFVCCRSRVSQAQFCPSSLSSVWLGSQASRLSRFACCLRSAATAFSEQPWFGISLRTILSLCPKEKARTMPIALKTPAEPHFLRHAWTHKLFHNNELHRSHRKIKNSRAIHILTGSLPVLYFLQPAQSVLLTNSCGTAEAEAVISFDTG
jgi:hypothetical protein